MKFECNGRLWDTVDLLELETADPAVTVYTDRASRLVFVGVRERDIGILVHRADDAEIEWVSDRYHLPQLLSYLG